MKILCTSALIFVLSFNTACAENKKRANHQETKWQEVKSTHEILLNYFVSKKWNKGSKLENKYFTMLDSKLIEPRLNTIFAIFKDNQELPKMMLLNGISLNKKIYLKHLIEGSNKKTLQFVIPLCGKYFPSDLHELGVTSIGLFHSDRYIRSLSAKIIGETKDKQYLKVIKKSLTFKTEKLESPIEKIPNLARRPSTIEELNFSNRDYSKASAIQAYADLGGDLKFLLNYAQKNLKINDFEKESEKETLVAVFKENDYKQAIPFLEILAIHFPEKNVSSSRDAVLALAKLKGIKAIEKYNKYLMRENSHQEDVYILLASGNKKEALDRYIKMMKNKDVNESFFASRQLTSMGNSKAALFMINYVFDLKNKKFYLNRLPDMRVENYYPKGYYRSIAPPEKELQTYLALTFSEDFKNILKLKDQKSFEEFYKKSKFATFYKGNYFDKWMNIKPSYVDGLMKCHTVSSLEYLIDNIESMDKVLMHKVAPWLRKVTGTKILAYKGAWREWYDPRKDKLYWNKSKKMFLERK
jgi:hypothetical protein